MADKPPFALALQSSTRFDQCKSSTILSHLNSSNSSLLTNNSLLNSQQLANNMAANSHHPEQSLASMAPPAKKFDINSLMSPPDPVLDSFSSHHNETNMGKQLGDGQSSIKHPMPMSPPISPYSRTVSTAESPACPPGQSIKDPLLYPGEDGIPSSPNQTPLFAPAEIEQHQRSIDNHVRSRSPTSFVQITPPKKEDYELVLYFKSQIGKLYAKNPRGWLRRERAFLLADRARSQKHRTIMPAAKPMTTKQQRSHRPDRVHKPAAAAPRPIRTHPGTATSPIRPAARRVSATPEPSRRVVAPNREDKDFNALNDYCPPLNSLPNRSNSLKVDWKGQPIDLSSDPNVSLLHPDEVTLAGNLRLDCATYLTSKRRIFERRLQCMRSGKEFRKTDAQQACKIDVNKASKLWTAFDKVGWLHDEWMEKFL